MNGGVTGTMEDLTELSCPAFPKTKQLASEENKDDSCCENGNGNEMHNYMEIVKETAVEETLDCSRNDDTNNSDILCDLKKPNTEEEVNSQECKKIPTENQCNNRRGVTEASTAPSDSQLTRSAEIENEKSDSEITSKSEELPNFNANIDNKETYNIKKLEDLLEGETTVMYIEEEHEEIVSLNSEIQNISHNDSSKENETKAVNDEVELIENEDKRNNQNGETQKSPSVEREDVTDDAKVVIENNVKPPVTENKVQLRRSSRTIKRKRYDDDMENGNDVSDDVVPIEDTLRRKSRSIAINDTKTLVQMAVKQMRGTASGHQKKETTVVILDTNAVAQNKPIPIKNSNNFLGAHNYMNYVGRGTSITPVTAKSSLSIQSSSSSSSQPLILPSLTDDMYVVEAPSFIVPYVYEKPSIKPFREFVDLLGNELEKQESKKENDFEEEKEKDKEKDEGNKDKKEEEEEKAEEEQKDEDEKEVEKEELKEKDEEKEDKKKSKEEKKAEKKKPRVNDDDDDASWDGESSSESDDEIASDDDEKTVVIKDKADLSDELKDVTRLPVDKVVCGKSDNYFDCSLGKFFMDIGLNLVQEFVQNDLLKQQNRKLSREKKAGQNTRATETSIASLMKNLEISQEKNSPYRYKQNKCEFCSFKSESMLIMLHHLETPHMKNNVYKCNYCSFEIRSPHDILYHMEAEHNVRGKLERAPAYHQCANCPFEDNGKGKLARHLLPCAKKFKPDTNLAPPVEWEPPAKIPKVIRSRNNMMGTYHTAFNRSSMGVRAPLLCGMTPTGAYRARGRSPLLPAPRAALPAPVLRGSPLVRQSSPLLLPTNYANGKSVGVGKSMHQPSISITPLPRQPQPAQPLPAHQNKESFVICEICDGYIKDLEQLRNHMQWIHKVKIHPKMIYNRPPLNCQKCQCRFFTDQGLERHLLGSHGLVTSSMQEAANKGKDAGRCPVCGRVYQWKLLNHVARDHSLTLKPAHLSYKCTVCTATFGMYKQFENHVYSAHSVVAKRVMDKSKMAPAKPANDSLLKPLKINDEITIIPQSTKAAPAKQK